jgi:hypothetical protein
LATTTSQRPLGIVLIVIFMGFFGVLGALGGACAMIAGGTLDTAMDASLLMGPGLGASPHDMPQFGIGFILMSLVGVVLSVLQVAAAYGLWSFQQWGRPLGMALAAFAFAWTLLSLVMYGTAGGAYILLWFILVLVINAVIVWYLRTPAITALYARSAPTA